MTREAEGRAPSIDEAIERALDASGAVRDEVDVEVVQEPSDDAEAIVRVRPRSMETAEPAPRPPRPRRDEPDADALEEQADAAADFLDELLARMDIDAIAEPNPQGSHMYVDIVDGPEEDMSLLIGRNGQTLEAIQELTRMVVSRKLDQRVADHHRCRGLPKAARSPAGGACSRVGTAGPRNRQRGGARADELLRAQARPRRCRRGRRGRDASRAAKSPPDTS